MPTNSFAKQPGANLLQSSPLAHLRSLSSQPAFPPSALPTSPPIFAEVSESQAEVHPQLCYKRPMDKTRKRHNRDTKAAGMSDYA